jgi:hypothetical protein
MMASAPLLARRDVGTREPGGHYSGVSYSRESGAQAVS